MKYRVLFPFCGLGAGALGFLRASAVVLGLEHTFESAGGIDLDPASCRDFETLTLSPALCADIATMTPDELRAFVGPKAPHVVFLSPPCNGFSGLLSEKMSRTPKYQALNALVVKCIELIFATWPDAPPAMILIENVPRIETRGASLLRRVRSILRQHGYVSHGSAHDCGEIGGLAQHRKRFLLVARHATQVPTLLYEPMRKRVRGCGEVLGTLPLPGDPAGGPMHQLPKISTLNWIRLALIPPGGDWRDIPADLSGFGPNTHANVCVIHPWGEPVGTITSSSRPGSGAQLVADPRAGRHTMNWHLTPWRAPASTIIGATDVQNGAALVADVRLATGYPHTYGVLDWSRPSHTVTGATTPGMGPVSVGDVRVSAAYGGVYGIAQWNDPAGAVTGAASPSTGTFSLADPRLTCTPRATSGAYGVLAWDRPAWTVSGSLQIDNGWAAVADPRVPGNPSLRVRWVPSTAKSAPPFAPVLPTVDGTWHRPLTTLELAALQGLPVTIDGKPLVLDGSSTAGWRERIGNAVPVATAEAIARQMLLTLAQANAGTWSLSSGGDVWVEQAEGALQ